MSNNRAYQIAFQIGANMNSSVRTAFANTNRQLQNTNTSTQHLNKSMGSLKNVIIGVGSAVAGAFAIQKLTAFGKSIIETTASLSAVQEQYEQVMSTMLSDSDAYLNKMSMTWNKHPNELKGTLMQYYAILKGKGIEEKKAYELAQAYLERSVDANMFANESMADTTARFMGMIKGEYSSVDTAMVNLNVTMLNDKALQMYKKKWADLSITEQEVLKTQEALRQHTAAGVFGQGIREADSYENNIAMIKNSWEKLQSQLGTPILPIVNNVLKKISTTIQKIDVDKLIDSFSKMKNYLPDMSKISGSFSQIKTTAKDVINQIKPIISEVINFMQPIINQVFITYQTIFNNLKDFWKSHGSNILAAAKDMFSKFKTVFSTVLSIITPILFDAINFIKGIFSQISTFWDENGAQILQAVQNVWGFIVKIIKGITPIVMFIVNSLWANVKGAIQGVLDVILGVVKIFTGIFTGDWRKAWDGVKDTVKGAVSAVWNIWNLLIVGKLFGSIKAIGTSILGFFKGIGTNVVNSVKSIFTNSTNFISNAFSKIWGFVSNLGTHVGTVFSNIKTAITHPFTTLKDIVKGAIDAVKGIVGGLFEGVTNFGKSAINGLISGINAMINGVNKLSVKVPDWVPKIGGNTIGFNISQIPMLAKGGITTGPTLAMIGEGKEQEAVLPLSKLDALLGKGNTTNNNRNQNNSNTDQKFEFHFHYDGPATKEEAVNFANMSFERFAQLMKKYQNEQRRLGFGVN